MTHCFPVQRLPIPRPPRVRFIHPVWLQPIEPGEKVQRLHSTNLSTGGMFIRSYTPPATGTQYELLLESKGKAFRLARAEVIWQGPGFSASAAGFGVRFLDVRPRAQELIEYLVGHSMTLEEKNLDTPQASVEGQLAAPARMPEPTTPVEIVHFPPVAKQAQLPSSYFESSNTSLYDIPEDTAVTDPIQLTESKVLDRARIPTEEEFPVDETLRTPKKWFVFMAFAMLGAILVLLLGPSLRTDNLPETEALAPAPEAAPLPLPAPTPEQALPPETEVAAAPSDSALDTPRALEVAEGETSVQLSGAITRVEALVVENTLDAEMFLAPNARIQNWGLLQNPPRLFVDATGARPSSLQGYDMVGGLHVRVGLKPNGMRVVLDLPELPKHTQRKGNHFLLTFPPSTP